MHVLVMMPVLLYLLFYCMFADLVVVESDHTEILASEVEIAMCDSDSCSSDSLEYNADNSMIHAESTFSTEVLNDNVSQIVLSSSSFSSSSSTNNQFKCQGFHPNIPQPFTHNYPFQLHSFFLFPSHSHSRQYFP